MDEEEARLHPADDARQSAHGDVATAADATGDAAPNAIGEVDTQSSRSETAVEVLASQNRPQCATIATEDIAVDEREVLFLIANYLEKREESKHAAQTLIADLSSSDLLGESVSWNGQAKNLTYADYKRRHRDLGPDHLLHILKTALTAKSPRVSASGSALLASQSLLLKSRATSRRKPLTPAERMAIQAEIIDKTVRLRKLQRTEALVKRIVSKYDRMMQFLEDSKFESLPLDVRYALQASSVATVNVTALAADVRAVRQLLQVRDEKASLQMNVYELLVKAKNAGAMQSTARTGRNHLSRIHRREISMTATPQLPPVYIYSRIRRLKTLNGHLQIPAYCMTYDKTGKFVITGADDRLIKIWSLQTGDLRFTLRGHVGNITDLAVNQSNTMLASSSDDKTVRVWELSTGAPVAVLLGHTSVVNSIRFHPEKNIVVTASDDGNCFCYRLPDIAKFDELETKAQTAKRLLNQGAYLLTLRPAYSLRHAKDQPNVRSHKVLCLNFSRCGNYVVTGGHDGVGRVWDVSPIASSDGQGAVSEFHVALQDPMLVLSPPTPVQPNEPTDVPPLVLEPAIQEGETGTEVVAIAEESVAPMVLDPQVRQDVAIPLLPRLPIDGPPRQDIAMPMVPPVIPIAPERRGDASRQQPQLAPVQQSRHVVVNIDQVTVITDPVAFLKGHTGPVTNILFSHKGDRIATASIKDGTTRVWQWEKKYKKVTHKVLFLDEHSRERELAMLYGISSRKKTPPAVDTLVWTRNDKRLITLHSTKPDSGTGEGDWRQRMRVWDPMTGKLEMTLAAVDKNKENGHVNAVFAMDVHPTDWRIVVTAGHDGRVFIWDISEGRMLKSFVVTSPEGETVALLDGSFMPTGDGFCFTDRLGRLCIFGTGSGEHLSAVPVQQYFFSDYAGLVTDRQFNVIDRETQTAPSLMESGPLVDIFKVRYPHQPPHLMASKGAWTKEEYEENRRKRVQQCMELEVASKVRHLPSDDACDGEENFPLAIVEPPAPRQNLDTTASGPLLATNSYRLNGDAVLQAEILRRANLSRRRQNQEQARQRTDPSIEERDTSFMNDAISSDDDRSDEDFQVPANRRTEHDDEDGDEDDDDDDDEEDSEVDDDDMLSDASDAPEGERLLRRRARRPLSARGRRLGRQGVEESGDEAVGVRSRRSRALARARLVEDEDEEHVHEVDGEEGGGVDRLRRQTRSRSLSAETIDSTAEGVIVESNDGFIMGDNQLDKFDTSITFDQMLQGKAEQLAASGNTSDTALIVCAFCGEGDDRGLLKLPGDAMGVHPLINGTQRLFVHDQCTIASPLCFNRNGKWYNVTKEIRRGRSIVCFECKKRGATVGCNLERCPKSYHWKCAVTCGWSINQIHFYCPDHASLGNSQTPGASGVDREMQHRLGLTFHREWLQLPSLVGMHPYVPQMGDNLVYFPEGHAQFLKITELKEPAFLRQMSRFVSLKCRVVGVKYQFPTLAEYRVGIDGQKAIQCDIELAVLAVPAAAFPTRGQDHEEEKEEKQETDESMVPEGETLFISDAPSFSKFVSVNQFLQPVDAQECERLAIKVRFFSNDVSNFLVLDHTYEAGISGNWKIGQRVRMPLIELNQGLQIDCKTSLGTIEKILTRHSVANPAVMTPWEAIYVRWDAEDEEDCTVSPWELEPATATENAVKRERERDLVAVKLHKSRQLSQQRRRLLAEALSSMMQLSIAKDFAAPVSSEYADYMVTVANPIDLTKIRDRVLAGYYRQLDAFIADVELLHANCETYNVSTSDIAQNARSITSSILTSVQQICPEFFSNRPETDTTTSHVLQYPPTDFGVNQDEEIAEVDDFEFEVEGGHAAAMQRVAEAEAAVAPQELSDVDSDLAAVLDDLADVMQSTRRSTRASTSLNQGDAVVEALAGSPRPSRHAAVAAAGTPERRRAPVPVTAAATPERRRTSVAPTEMATPERRTKRESAVLNEPSAEALKSSSTRKRPRTSDAHRILKLGDVLNALTTDQRGLYNERAMEDLPSLLRDFHEALMGADGYGIFGVPVTEDVAPGYFNVITNPMDFGTILDSIERYTRFSSYFEHVELVFTNAITYNSWESEIGAIVKEMQEYCVKFLLDAIGASAKAKPKARGRSTGSHVNKRKRRAVSDDDDDDDDGEQEESSDSSGSGSDVANVKVEKNDDSSDGSADDDDSDEDAADDDDDDDDDDEEEDDEDSEPDWNDDEKPRRRRMKREVTKKPKAKKAKAGKAAKKSGGRPKAKRARTSRR